MDTDSIDFMRMNIQRVLRDQQIIHSDPEIMSGTPVFVGTRVPLQTLFDYLEGEAGFNTIRISANYNPGFLKKPGF